MAQPSPSTYVVGGAVRDQLLGCPAADRDWVVIGATPEQMLAEGFLPVGSNFPVFLHPQTNEEYALGRGVRPAGVRGVADRFAVVADPTVTLEQDLWRRDLTINAIALAADGTFVDPYNGRQDLADRVLRHVSPAFTEDPVRILRVARFAARYPAFTVAPETRRLMTAMVAAGELAALTPERIWKELSRGLMAARPSRMLAVLHDCGALAAVLPEVAALAGVPQPAAHHPEIDSLVHVGLALDAAATAGASLPSRFGVLVHDIGKALTPAELLPAHHGHENTGAPLVDALSKRLRVPSECREVALGVTRHHTLFHRVAELQASTVVKTLGRIDALRRPERLQAVLAACAADQRGRLGREDDDYPPQAAWMSALVAARAVDAGAIAAATTNKALIAEQVYRARIAAVKAARRAPAPVRPTPR